MCSVRDESGVFAAVPALALMITITRMDGPRSLRARFGECNGGKPVPSLPPGGVWCANASHLGDDNSHAQRRACGRAFDAAGESSIYRGHRCQIAPGRAALSQPGILPPLATIQSAA